MKRWVFGVCILLIAGLLVLEFDAVSSIVPGGFNVWRRIAGGSKVVSHDLWQLKMERRRNLIGERTQQIHSWLNRKAINARRVYDLFEPEYDCNTKTRVGVNYFGEGPKFMCDVEVTPPQRTCLVYSVGSNGKFSFETAIFNRFKCESHTFDPTDTTGTWEKKAKNAHTTFHDVGLGEKKEFVKIVHSYSKKEKHGCALDIFGSIVHKLGHDGRLIDVLKIDCSGCEWKVFDEIWTDLEQKRYRIGQILIQVHGADFRKAVKFFEGARKAGYMIFSKERIHHGRIGFDCLEFAFVHEDLARNSSNLYRSLFQSTDIVESPVIKPQVPLQLALTQRTCFHLPPTCLWIEITGSGFLGNYMQQLKVAWDLVSKCGGIIIPISFKHLDFPTFISPYFGKNASIFPAMSKCRKFQAAMPELFYKKYPDWLNTLLTQCNCSGGSDFGIEPNVSPDLKWLEKNEWNRKSLDDYIVLHLRGGDIMKKKPHSGYWQPPCSYYVRAIKHSKKQKVLIVSQDSLNPCVKYLQKQYPASEAAIGVEIGSSFFLLMNSVSLVVGTSTFGSNAAFFSKTLETVYSRSRIHLRNPSVRQCAVFFENKDLLPWNASTFQLEKLLSLPSKEPVCSV